MCGIVGYTGKRNGTGIVLAGLEHLEYRGYDSAGIVALTRTGRAAYEKQTGRVSGLAAAIHGKREFSTAPLAIGHTRWATHGSPTSTNAHPQMNTARTIFVVHNGIVENYVQLRDFLMGHGYVFVSETDTEVIPHLLDYYYHETASFERAFIRTMQEIRGAYAILACFTGEPDTLFAARLSSPMVLGIGDGECTVASDPSVIVQHTKQVLYLNDYEMAIVGKGSYRIHNLVDDRMVERAAETTDVVHRQADKGTYPDFTLKEIHEIPEAIRLSCLGRVHPEDKLVKLGGLEAVAEQLSGIERIVIVACGSASYAGMVGEYLLEEIAGIPVEVQLASEFKYRNEPFSRSTLLLAISQSGETADVIAAINKVKPLGVLTIGIVNAVGSTVARMTDAGVYCHVGTEQAVASTKAVAAQITILLLLSLKLAGRQYPHYDELLQEISTLPKKAAVLLRQASTIEQLAQKYYQHRDFLFIGRGYMYPAALEGAIKLKELCYDIHAEGYAAGEMKHGPLAMIDADFPTFALATASPILEKTYSNMQEIKARGGKIIAVATEGDKTVAHHADDVIFIPKTSEQTAPILVNIVTQLFAYYVARAMGHEVDRPRNLAKSVTVE